MPGGDKTGPLGMGPLTGRGAGYCRGYGMPGYANRWGAAGWGGGYGRGGYGRGWRNRWFATGVPGWAWSPSYAAASPVNATRSSAGSERGWLEEQAAFLRSELAEIDRRISELKTEKDMK